MIGLMWRSVDHPGKLMFSPDLSLSRYLHRPLPVSLSLKEGVFGGDYWGSLAIHVLWRAVKAKASRSGSLGSVNVVHGDGLSPRLCCQMFPVSHIRSLSLHWGDFPEIPAGACAHIWLQKQISAGAQLLPTGTKCSELSQLTLSVMVAVAIRVS